MLVAPWETWLPWWPNSTFLRTPTYLQLKIRYVGKLVSVIGNRKSFPAFVENIMEMKKEIKLSQVLQRELKGKVISRVAKEIGISVSILHDWYSSSRKPSAKNMWHLKKLADYLGLAFRALLMRRKLNFRPSIENTVTV